MRLRKFAAIALLPTLALPCMAGIRFTAETRIEGELQTRVNALVSGTHAKVTFLNAVPNMAGEGDYMVSPDAGKTLYLVSPTAQTYTRYDVRIMLSGMGMMVHDMRGLMKVSFESPKIEKLAEEDGGTVAGLPTRHYRYRTSYTMSMDAPNAHKITTTIEEEIWTSTQLNDPALAVWLKKDQPTTGDDELDSMIRAEMEKVQGFPLKRLTTTHTVDAKGVPRTTRSEMRVTELKQVEIPDLEFAIPGEYQEVRPVRPGEQD